MSFVRAVRHSGPEIIYGAVLSMGNARSCGEAPQFGRGAVGKQQARNKGLHRRTCGGLLWAPVLGLEESLEVPVSPPPLGERLRRVGEVERTPLCGGQGLRGEGAGSVVAAEGAPAVLSAEIRCSWTVARLNPPLVSWRRVMVSRLLAMAAASRVSSLMPVGSRWWVRATCLAPEAQPPGSPAS